MAVNRVEGLETVLNNLNAEIDKIEGRSMAGLWDAGLQVQASAQRRLKDSVVTGNLRASAYTRASDKFTRLDPARMDKSKNNRKPSSPLPNAVEIGFTAVYGIFAHENMEGRAPKFLENALRENQDDIVEIIRRRAEVE